MKQHEKPIIYVNLDRAIHDGKSCSTREALSALRVAQERGVPVIFCSSRTRAEIEGLRKKWEARDPFIVENGGAIYTPKGYFPFVVESSETRDGYDVIEMGEPYWRLVNAFRLLRSDLPGLGVVGFSDLTVKELALECRMTLDEAARAKAREFSEPFRFSDSASDQVELFLQRVKQAGKQVSTGGRYFHLHDGFDMGVAVGFLNVMFRRVFGKIKTVGFGDSQYDAPMLSSVDFPVIVERPPGAQTLELESPEKIFKQFPSIGLADMRDSQGWADAVMRLIDEQH
jgi:mannosyl-3-phosphoglycerate phosphatase